MKENYSILKRWLHIVPTVRQILNIMEDERGGGGLRKLSKIVQLLMVRQYRKG
jgi:hypothetical protein